MKSKEKKRTCSGFPEKPGTCQKVATATVLRVPVCEEHAKKAEAKNHTVHR